MSLVATAYLECPDIEPAPAEGDEAELIAVELAKILGAEDDHRAVPPPFDRLPRMLGAEVARRWNEPCEAAFEFLLARDPEQLGALIVSGEIPVEDLTFAAEILGRAPKHALARVVIAPLLHHADAAVREGAIYGLQRHLNTNLRAHLQRLAHDDPSNAVRTAAKDALDE